MRWKPIKVRVVLSCKYKNLFKGEGLIKEKELKTPTLKTWQELRIFRSKISFYENKILKILQNVENRKLSLKGTITFDSKKGRLQLHHTNS